MRVDDAGKPVQFTNITDMSPDARLALADMVADAVASGVPVNNVIVPNASVDTADPDALYKTVTAALARVHFDQHQNQTTIVLPDSTIVVPAKQPQTK